MTVTANTPDLVKDEEENVVGVNVSFTLGGAAGFVLFLRKKRGGNTPNGDGPFGTAQ